MSQPPVFGDRFGRRYSPYLTLRLNIILECTDMRFASLVFAGLLGVAVPAAGQEPAAHAPSQADVDQLRSSDGLAVPGVTSREPTVSPLVCVCKVRAAGQNRT
jgi:hypothetical protein